MDGFKDEEEKVKQGLKKVYLVINGEKQYIDLKIVKKYNLEKLEVSFFSRRKLHVEED